MPRVRFRSLGPWGSSVELLVGAYLTWTTLASDEPFPTLAVVVMASVGVLVAGVGVIGLLRLGSRRRA